MQKIRFIDSNFECNVSLKLQSKRIICTFNNEEDVANAPLSEGFVEINEHNGIEQSDYSEYKYVYKEGADGLTYILTNDENDVYVEPEIIPDSDSNYEPYVPTLADLKVSKISSMNTTQQTTIQNGVNVTLSDGTVEHFTLTDHDQISLMGLQTQVLAGIEQIPWHSSDNAEHCKYYSNEDMALITNTAIQYVAYHVTYFRDLRIYINSLETQDDVEAIYYGITIPEEYKSEVLASMEASMTNA